MTVAAERRIPGDYQWRALHEGWRYQRAWHRARLALARELCAASPGMRVLDAASGSGLLAHVLSGSGARVYNLDLRPGACEVARQHEASAGAVAGTLSHLPFASNTFDVVCLLEVIEHLTPDETSLLLRDLRRVAAPGGRLILTTPNYASAWPLIERIVDATGLAPAMAGEQHVTRYDPASLGQLLAATGWTTVESGSFNLIAPLAGAVSRRIGDVLLRFERRRLRRAGLLLYAVAQST